MIKVDSGTTYGLGAGRRIIRDSMVEGGLFGAVAAGMAAGESSPLLLATSVLCIDPTPAASARALAAPCGSPRLPPLTGALSVADASAAAEVTSSSRVWFGSTDLAAASMLGCASPTLPRSGFDFPRCCGAPDPPGSMPMTEGWM